MKKFKGKIDQRKSIERNNNQNININMNIYIWTKNRQKLTQAPRTHKNKNEINIQNQTLYGHTRHELVNEFRILGSN